MGKRSRKPPPGQGEPKKRLTGAERDEIARAGLTPLEPGERPTPVVVASVVAVVLAVSNLGLFLAGVEVQGQKPKVFGVLLFGALMLVAAWGMWNLRYWALLGFQALLAVTLVIAGLSVMVAGNLLALILCLAVLGLGGWLFWKLVRVLGRVKVPRPGDHARPQ
ncbi:MAG: hypothetical protein ACKOK7_00905 [Solirubrobacterales bacterium]